MHEKKRPECLVELFQFSPPVDRFIGSVNHTFADVTLD